MGNCCFGSSSSGPDPIFEAIPDSASTSLYLSANSASVSAIKDEPNLKLFYFDDLEEATENFNPQLLLGEGGFGKVYKGWVDKITNRSCPRDTGLAVAIKRLNPHSEQGIQEWVAELNFLGSVAHPQLVKLLGYCWHGRELLLVYEFIERGSLANHLFRRDVEPLPWELRLNIAIGAANGLAFLHTLDKPIIYRDFKATNILLDSNYTAKLSDFGMAKMGPSEGNSYVSTRVVGTPGYVDPHYYKTGKLYVQSDVYSFGLVLLELLTGSRVVDLKRPNDQQDLVKWLKRQKKNFGTQMDRRIQGQYSTKAMLLAIELVIKCIARNPKRRLSMWQVVFQLERIKYYRRSTG